MGFISQLSNLSPNITDNSLKKKFSNMFLKNSNASAITVCIQITKKKYQNAKGKVWQPC